MSRNILLIITGSIAATKSIILLNLLKKSGYNIEVILTRSACEFFTNDELKELEAFQAKSELFSSEEFSDMAHINSSRRADLVCVYPATANFINKIAAGIADDLATNTILAANKEILIAPAMNVLMWQNPITQESVESLLEKKYKIIGPDSGALACGEEGEGRLVEAEVFFAVIQAHFNFSKFCKNKKIIITAGSTIEPIDPVRYISNYSSGKQGIRIAEMFKDLGADVLLITGKTEIKPRSDLNQIKIKTAMDMYEAVRENLPCSIFIAAAAVADYRPEIEMENKLKKSEHEKLQLNLIKNPDILAMVSLHHNRPDFVVGFAAETERLLENAKHKLLKKKCDLIVANNIAVSKIFGANQTNITLLDRKENTVTLQNLDKRLVALEIIKKLEIL